MAHFNSVERGPIIDVVGAVERSDLLRRARVDARQAPDSSQQVPVGAWIIHGPIAGKSAQAAPSDPYVVGIAVDIGITQPGANPFRRLFVVEGQRKVPVLDRGPFLEGLLRAQDTPNRQDSKASGQSCLPRRTPPALRAGWTEQSHDA